MAALLSFTYQETYRDQGMIVSLLCRCHEHQNIHTCVTVVRRFILMNNSLSRPHDKKFKNILSSVAFCSYLKPKNYGVMYSFSFSKYT